MGLPKFKTLAGKLLAINDGLFDRASMGNLDAYTDPRGVVSPAHYGFRSLDGNGNLLFDSIGLSSISPLYMTQGAINITVNTSGVSLVTVNSITFSTARQVDLLTWAPMGVMRIDANAGSYQCSMGLQLDGLYPSSSPYGDLGGDVVNWVIPAILNNSLASFPSFKAVFWRGVPAGSHTVAVVAQSGSANGVFQVAGNPSAISLGG